MKQLDPKAVWLFFLSLALRTFVPTIILSVYLLVFVAKRDSNFVDSTLSFGFFNWLWFIVPAYLVLCFVWAKLTYHFYRYELKDIGFRKESGVIIKKYVTIPYDRIQNVDINRGILDRLLGLSDLRIQTAGASATVSRYGVMGGGAEGRLPGVSVEIAEQLRDELVQRARGPRNQGL